MCNDENFWLTRLLNKEVYPLEEIRDFKGDFTYKEMYRHLFLNEYEQGIFEAVKRNNPYYYKVVSRGHFNSDRKRKIFQDAIKYNSFDVITYLLIQTESDSEKLDLEDEIYLSLNEKTVNWYLNMGLGNYAVYIMQLSRYRAEFADYVYEQFKKYLPYIKYEHIEVFKEVADNLGGAIATYTEDEDIEVFSKLEKIIDLFLQYVRKEDKPIIIKQILHGTEDYNYGVDEKFLKLWQKFLQDKI